MFKLLPLLLACIVAGNSALPKPDGHSNLISSSSSSIRRSYSKPYQNIILTARSQQHSQKLQTNSVTSVEDEDSSSSKNIDDIDDDQELIAPTSAITTATPTPTTAATGAAPASVTRLRAAVSPGSASASASASTSLTSLQFASSINLPASSSSSTTVQHHILPPETIPLPISISTHPGLRTVIAPETITIHEPTLVRVGEIVQNIPTAVSHQSQTVVHKHARIITPIVAPAVRTFTSQILRAYHTPLIFAPQTTVVRSSTFAGANASSGTDSRVNAKAVAKGGAASASASASIISNANNNNGENSSANSNTKN
ncbi:uncharacterized protein [Eurosta solidaginis]|uniref:uncharacterized protein n=1 Tax=Eurosta solidaginis TaxID=178769 RepID=UPI003530A2AB